MRFHESQVVFTRCNIIVLITGLILLLFSLFVDPIYLLQVAGVPVGKLYGQRGQADIVLMRCLSVILAVFMVAAPIILWKYPGVVISLIKRVEAFSAISAKLPLFTVWVLATVLLTKTVLQLSLHLIGYTSYSGDDFARILTADHWFQHYQELGWQGWLNLGSVQLPFPDYIFGLALALYRDLYITPKIVNVVLSSITVVVVYLLGRDLFGRTVGLLTAVVLAFQPWNIWLGISGMTSDLPSVVMIALFGLFLFRWLETDRPHALLAAAGCLFVADGMRYENWFFSAAFSVFLVISIVSRWRRRLLTGQSVALIVCTLAIANAFPIIYMTACYYTLGAWVPAMHQFRAFSDTPNPRWLTPRISIPALVLYAFPIEITAAVGGVALALRSEKYKSSRAYLFVLVMTFLLFALMFKGKVTAYGGPARYLFPHIVLLLPYVGFLIVQLLQLSSTGRLQYTVVGCFLLLAIATFDVVRAFNYPASFDRDAFETGRTLRTLQTLGSLPENGRILLEKIFIRNGVYDNPYPVGTMANSPERFVLLDESQVNSACDTGFQTEACRAILQEGHFNLMILSSRERVLNFQETFSGRSWQIGKYYIFELPSSPGEGEKKDDFSQGRLNMQGLTVQ